MHLDLCFIASNLNLLLASMHACSLESEAVTQRLKSFGPLLRSEVVAVSQVAYALMPQKT